MKRPVMIGAHVPKNKVTSRHRGLYAAAKEVNAAYDVWVRKRGRADLVFFKPAFNPTK